MPQRLRGFAMRSAGMNRETSRLAATGRAHARCLAVRVVLAAIGFVLAAATVGSPAAALDATAFGWRAKEAKGTRPLLVIWVREPDDTPAGELARRKQYYDEVWFGRPAHGAYPDAVRTF